MASFQSQFEETDIADQLAAGQRAISVAEFFEKNKHMLGFDSEARALVTAVKEGTDNSLDACEEAGFLPDIYIEIRETGDYYTLVVEDNGPGITKEQIPKIFGKMLYGSRFHRREQSLLPNQQVLVKLDGTPELIKIGDLCDAFIPKIKGSASERVPVDLQAPCFDRQTGEVHWQDVTHVHRHETDHDVYRVETARGRSIEVTGNHSLFTLSSTGDIAEVEAGALSEGDYVVAPERLPSPGEIDEVNVLSYIPRAELDERDWYVYGVDSNVIRDIEEQGEVVRKRTSPDNDRRRYFYRINGVDVQQDLHRQFLEKGYLPAELVADFGWEDRVADCVIRTYQVGGAPTEIPVTVPLSREFMRFLGLFVAEGHSGTRQIGFTFGDHERDLIEEIENTASAVLGAGTTTVPRQRNNTGVKAFGSPLAVFMASVCGVRAKNKQIPPFVFNAPSEAKQAFIDALYDGDGSDAHPGNQLEFSTVSDRLALELSYLWSMRGVAASVKEHTTEDNIVGSRSTVYKVLVYGEDIEKSNKYDVETDRLARYRRLPTSIVENVTDRRCPRETVPPTRAGVFYAAGLGSHLSVAQEFVRWVEYILEGGYIPPNFYRATLETAGLLTEDGDPTDKLEQFWVRSERFLEFMRSDLCLLPVASISEREAPEYVYDISVPGSGADENFVAGNRGPLFAKNSRGQQGLGISAAVLYAQLTSGTPAKITSRTPSADEANYYELIIDTEENEPEIQAERTTTWDRPHGTRIELRLEANLRARQQLHDYVTHTAIVNPHARIELIEPGASFKFDRATDQLPAETISIRPHPHGVELGTVIKMLDATDSYSLSGFLQGEFTRVGKKTADEVLDAFRDRHFGRELAWGPPPAVAEIDLARSVQAAVANKSAAATAAFAERVADGVADAGAVAHHELVALVDATADAVEAEFGDTFGATVRENAVDAAFEALTADRVTPLFERVREATSSRKDDETVRAFVERLAPKLDGVERDRLTRARLVEFVDRAADMTAEYADVSFGETAREHVVEAVWGGMRAVPDELPSVRDVARARDAAADLVAAMRSVEVMAPPTDCLSPITAELIEEGLRKEVDADFYRAVTRDAEVHGGDPFIIEAGIAYGGELEAESRAELLRFANRVPLVYQQGACAVTDVVRSIDWRNYGLDQPGGSGLPGGPAMVLVHVASTNVPFTSESKDAVANVPAIEKEVELAVREAARGMKAHLNKRRSLQQRRQKQSVIADILPKMAAKVASVTGRDPPPVDESLARIMNNVLVAREANGDDVELVVENHTDASVSLEVSEVLDAEPTDATAGRVVDLDDGEWVVKWDVTVGAGERASLRYGLDGDATSDLTVDGPEPEKLTIHA